METIFLTGFRSVGKTMVGKLLASRKDLEFVDTDQYIVDKENRSIEEIRNSSGEKYLRNLEKYVLENSISQGAIVALGTYIPMHEENIMAIKRNGRVIYLRAKAETILENIKNDTEKVAYKGKDFSIFTIQKELDEMETYYEQIANFIIDIDGKKLNQVFKEALAIYNFANKVKCHIYIK